MLLGVLESKNIWLICRRIFNKRPDGPFGHSNQNSQISIGMIMAGIVLCYVTITENSAALSENCSRSKSAANSPYSSAIVSLKAVASSTVNISSSPSAKRVPSKSVPSKMLWSPSVYCTSSASSVSSAIAASTSSSATSVTSSLTTTESATAMGSAISTWSSTWPSVCLSF